MVIQRVGLHQIDYIEAVQFACAYIGNAEVVPLSVAARVVVGLQDQVVLKLVNLDRSSQVSTFKSALELECDVRIGLLHIVWWVFAIFARRRHSVRPVSRRVDSVEYNAAQDVIGRTDALCLPPERFLKDELLRRI